MVADLTVETCGYTINHSHLRGWCVFGLVRKVSLGKPSKRAQEAVDKFETVGLKCADSAASFASRGPLANALRVAVDSYAQGGLAKMPSILRAIPNPEGVAP